MQNAQRLIYMDLPGGSGVMPSFPRLPWVFMPNPRRLRRLHCFFEDTFPQIAAREVRPLNLNAL